MRVIAIETDPKGTNQKGGNSMPVQPARIIQPTRREAIIGGGAALGSLVVGPDFSRAAECILTSRQIDGPYHIQDAEDRRDVRSGKPGVDLLLRMKIVDADGCEGISGVRTEIWSCDALGNYSGHPDVDPNVPPNLGGAGRPPGGGTGRPPGGRRPPGAGGGRPGAGGGRPGGPGGGFRGGGHREPTGPRRFLRGSQVANDQGELEFLTLYPGWYNPRAVHVHVKVHLGGQELLTTQLYFPDELTDSIHQTEHYAARYPTPFPNSKDQVKYWTTAGEEPVGVFPTMTTDGKTQVGTLTVGVKRA